MSAQEKESQARELALLKKELAQIKLSNAYILAVWAQAYYAKSPVLRWLWRCLARVTRPIRRLRKLRAAKVQADVSDDLRNRFEDSVFFDSAYYGEKYSDVIKTPEDLVSDYICSFPAEVRDPGALFSARHYQTLHPDVLRAGVHPFVHFLLNGQNEGRAALAPHRINTFLKGLEALPLALSALIPCGQSVRLHCYDRGNFFFSDIAGYVGDYLVHLGYKIDDDASASLDLVVAPHEFMVQGPGRQWSAERIENTICLNTEQWQTSWFTLALTFMQKSKIGCLDINPMSAVGLTQLGLRCAFLPMLSLPGSCFDQVRQPLSESLSARRFIRELTYPPLFNQRGYDVMLVAVSNPRREYMLAELAPTLSQFNTFIHCPGFDGPIAMGDPDAICSSDLTQLAKNSKILLNIHRDEMPYFEWHRLFLYGMMNGCVVVTEACYNSPYLKAGEHYLEAPASELPDLLKHLLTTREGQAQLMQVHTHTQLLRQEIASKDYAWL